MASIFVSHSHADREFARRLAAELRAAGVTVWIDEAFVSPGDPLRDHLQRGLAEADCFGIVLSPDAIASEWVQYELNLVLELESRGITKRLIPLLLHPCKVPPPLSERVQVNFTDPHRFHLGTAELLRAVVGGPPPLWLTGREAARLVKATNDPPGVLITLSQQGAAQQYIQHSVYEDWLFADVKTGRSRVWIADYLDVSSNEVYPFGIRDGNITEYPSATLQHEMPVLDFNFLDSDVAVPLAVDTAIAKGGVPPNRNSFFVTAQLAYWRSKSVWAWTVSFLDAALSSATCGVIIDARAGDVLYYEQPPR